MGNFGVEDLSNLEVVTEDTILDCLQSRYDESQIYTYIGDVLVAVNPFKDLEIYGREEHEEFSSAHQSSRRPHLYGVARRAFQQLTNNNRPQCVFVSGESGAGKTETTKLIVRHVTYLSRADIMTISEKLNKVNPLLEAFGNAETVMNRNSSRYVKYVEMFFTKDGHILGGKVSDYMLEKCRVVQQGKKEQNFHIFYTVLGGMPQDRLRIYHLNAPEDYRIVNGNSLCLEHMRKHPQIYRRKFQELESQLRLEGFTYEDLNNIYQMLAATIHIANIEFVPADTSDKNSAAEIRDLKPLELACSLLCSDLESLKDALTFAEFWARGEKITVVNTVTKACDIRDALAKWMYERLFGWVVRHVNENLVPQSFSDMEETPHVIGILDIAGFENFQTNNFEQLCINVANERLHHYFNEYIFSQEQNDYEAEGIAWEHITFQNNEELLEIFNKTPVNAFSLLDEECRLIPIGSDVSYVQKMNDNFGGKANYVRSKSDLVFGIIHYAGKVVYNASGFVEKNRDNLSAHVIDCMKFSDNLLISDLFSAELTSTGTISGSKSVIRRGMTTKAEKMAKMQGVTGRKGSTVCQNSLASYFKNSLRELIEKMKRSETHFIRCLKPNDEQRPGNFQKDKVRQQLQSNGITAVVRIRKQGFPVRLSIQEFNDRYQALSTRKLFDRDLCLHILGKLEFCNQHRQYDVGRQKVFLKLKAQQALDALKQRRIQAALTTQRFIRGYLAREKYRPQILKNLEERRRQEKIEEIRRKEEETKKIREKEMKIKLVSFPIEEHPRNHSSASNSSTNEYNPSTDGKEFQGGRMDSNATNEHRPSDATSHSTRSSISSQLIEKRSRMTRLLTEEEFNIIRDDSDSDVDMETVAPIEDFDYVDGSWDRFNENDDDDYIAGRCYQRTLKILKICLYLVLFLLVLGSSFIGKLSILMMTSGMYYLKNIPKDIIKNGELQGGQIRNTIFTFLILCITLPYLFVFLVSFFKTIFGSQRWPACKILLLALLTEGLHTLGLVLLIFCVLPHLCLLQAVLLVNATALIPALFKLFSPVNRESLGFKGVLGKLLDFVACLVQLSAPAALVLLKLFNVDFLEATHFNFVWQAPLGLILVSMPLWENFTGGRLLGTRMAIHAGRQKLTSVTSLYKIGCTILFAYYFNMANGIELHFDINVFTLLIQGTSANSTNITHALDSNISVGQVFIHLSPFLAQVLSVLICVFFTRQACKLCMQHIGFSLPLLLLTPMAVAILLSNEKYHFLPNSLSILDDGDLHIVYLFDYCQQETASVWFIWTMIAGSVWWLSLVWISVHIWYPRSNRFARNEDLFISSYFCGALIDTWNMFNRRCNDKERFLKWKVEDVQNFSKRAKINPDLGASMTLSTMSSLKGDDFDDNVVPMIYACATMWHETRVEMTQLMKSIFKMDEDHKVRELQRKQFKIIDRDYYEVETHIFFDDAMEKNKNNQWVPNGFVRQFVEVMDEILSEVLRTTDGKSPRPPTKWTTPYGGRLEWILPGGTKLITHLKNKNKIRHRKRWSQVMYMYYLLGYRTLQEHEVNIQEVTDNTFLLALDGDVDFKPEAVSLLVDKMKKNPLVGAVCGRIHPIGSGPMVWYQLFEYAIGHWLQKATEHVLGCVLCSPGCFSLFRGSALMDDNVMKRYTQKPEQASHYVQYDQGEDRWLCTLLLQRGYRVDYVAASDALTYVPETFNEFFNQRRRWLPSTMANTLDLLQDYKNTVRRNDNISYLYIAYQFILMVTTVLGPATVALMIASSIRSLFPSLDVYLSNLIASGPLIVFFVVCFVTKSSTQLFVAGILSALYALLMMAVIVGTVVTAATDGFLNPSVVFLIGLTTVYVVAGLLHPKELACLLPGVLYFLCIPAGYLILVIYSLCNLNVVSWGTREGPSKTASAEKETQKSKGIMALFKSGGLQELKELFGGKNSEVQQRIIHLLESLDEKMKLLINKEKKSEHDVELGDYDLPGDVTQDAIPDEDSEKPVKMSQQNDLSTPEAEDTDFWAKQPWLGLGKEKQITVEEKMFWRHFIDKYLLPLENDKEDQKRVAAELIGLRNDVNFGFWMINAIWMVLNMALQDQRTKKLLSFTFGVDENGRDISVEIVSFVFLVTFALILLFQVFGMFLHRWGTFVHLMSFTSLSPNSFRNIDPENLDKSELDEDDLPHVLHFTRQLVREQMLEEPEPDYSDDDDYEDVEYRRGASNPRRTTFNNANRQSTQESIYEEIPPGPQLFRQLKRGMTKRQRGDETEPKGPRNRLPRTEWNHHDGNTHVSFRYRDVPQLRFLDNVKNLVPPVGHQRVDSRRPTTRRSRYGGRYHGHERDALGRAFERGLSRYLKGSRKRNDGQRGYIPNGGNAARDQEIHLTNIYEESTNL